MAKKIAICAVAQIKNDPELSLFTFSEHVA